MTPDLFPPEVGRQDSPRLSWIKRHQVLTYHLVGTGEWLAGFVAGENYAKIAASSDETSQWFCDETGENGDSSIGIGATEDEAIAELMTTWYATSHGIRLWNEEPADARKSAWLTLHRVTVRPFGNRWEARRADPPTTYIGATEDEAIAGIAGMMRVGLY
jgi:hypothetical protein